MCKEQLDLRLSSRYIFQLIRVKTNNLRGETLIPTLPAPKTDIKASITSRGNLTLFSIEPPYSSVLLFAEVLKNWSIRYPFAPCNSKPSKPAALALRAPCLNISTYSFICSFDNSIGTLYSPPPWGLNLIGTLDELTGINPF